MLFTAPQHPDKSTHTHTHPTQSTFASRERRVWTGDEDEVAGAPQIGLGGAL